MEKNTVPNVLKAIKENEIIFATDGSVLPILATYSWVIAKKQTEQIILKNKEWVYGFHPSSY